MPQVLRMLPSLPNGGAEDGVGGGICQVSSTLYVATLRADLEIVERKNHSLYVSYVPLGQDATVAYGAVDYRFKNNTNYPIKVVAYTKGSSLTVSLLGTQTQNKKVEIVTQTLSYDPFQVIYQEDSSLAPGTTQVKNGGYPGIRRCLIGWCTSTARKSAGHWKTTAAISVWIR